MNGPLDQWYDIAGVRSGIRRMFADETDAGKVFFPQRLVPYLAHEALADLPESQRRALTIRHLYQFLLSTTHLETRVVNTAAELIANNRAGLNVPNAMRLDAFKVYCDEGYHSLYSLDLAEQITSATGVGIPPWNYGGIVDWLQETGRRLLPDEAALVPLLQTVVFETLITAVLIEIPNDPSVVTAVRDVTLDHAKDEGHHHRFFVQFFHELWTNLDHRLREPVALLMSGVDSPTAATVVADVYAETSSNADICRATLRTFRSAGVLEVPGAEEAFAAHALL
jgi:hypothetical protein